MNLGTAYYQGIRQDAQTQLVEIARHIVYSLEKNKLTLDHQVEFIFFEGKHWQYWLKMYDSYVVITSWGKVFLAEEITLEVEQLPQIKDKQVMKRLCRIILKLHCKVAA